MREEWSLRRRWKSIEAGRGEPATSAPEAEADAPPEESGSACPTAGTFIGTGALFQGTLRLKGDFCIDSEFHGCLSTNGSLTVGPSGSVEGDIRAREVIVAGAVVGDIVARSQLILRSGARLHGNVETACLEIERHAYFNGRTAMTRPHADPRPTPPHETVVVARGVASPPSV